MHILINGTFWNQPNVGSGQYLHGLIRWLPRVAPQHRYTLLLPATQDPTPEPPVAVSTLTLNTPFDQRNKNLAKLWFEQIRIPQITHRLTKNNQHGTILHIPYFAPPYHSAVPVVTTIPDIIPLILPAYRGNMLVRAYMALVRQTARRSAHLITFSQHSRQDIIKHFNITGENISAIMLAADERYQPAADQNAVKREVARRYQLTGDFIYYVGGLDVRKNVGILIQALAQMRHQKESPIPLVIAGRALSNNRHLFPDLEKRIKKTRLKNLVHCIEVPHEDGPLLYQSCTVFAFPSTYEGFGLPPLEAMACGAPVISSNASSLPEVVGQAAMTLDPHDVNAWATTLSRVTKGTILREELKRRSLLQAQRFTWKQVAEETVAVYEQQREYPVG